MPFAGRHESGYGKGGIPYTAAEMTSEKKIVFKRSRLTAFRRVRLFPSAFSLERVNQQPRLGVRATSLNPYCERGRIGSENEKGSAGAETLQ